MKPIFRLMIIIVTALLCVSFIGCGEDDEEDKKDNVVIAYDFDYVGTTWQIVSIDGQEIEEFFKQKMLGGFDAEDPVEFETEFEFEIETEFDIMYGGNSWIFDTDGSFTGMLTFTLTEKFPDQGSLIRKEVTIKSEGEYTSDDTYLKITKHNGMADATVTLEPKEVWEQQVLWITVEVLEKMMEEEAKLGFRTVTSDAVFKRGSEYTWDLDEDTLMFSVSHQEIALERVSE